jgi:thymidylate synthase (FAD)
MNFVEPKIFHIASTATDRKGLNNYLIHIGVPDWYSTANSFGEEIIEVAGRVCYRSFAPLLNKNVTKIRTVNKLYLENVLNKHDGSILEHCYDTYIITNVSRVFCMELLRHRHCNFSQESLRYVRLEELNMYLPDAFINNPKSEEIIGLFKESVYQDEKLQIKLAELLELDSNDFEVKKQLTSAMRRLAPDGLTTTIVLTSNHRNYRWMIEMRTSDYAEEEIRKVFYLIFQDLKDRYPNIYQDSIETPSEKFSTPIITFKNSKV